MASKLFIIPFSLSVLIVFGPFILYSLIHKFDPILFKDHFSVLSIAEYFGHINVTIPYISETGENPPEAAIFTYLFNIGSVLVSFTVYVRYKIFLAKQQQQCNTKYSHNETSGDVLNSHYFNLSYSERQLVLNSLSLLCGILTVIGLSIIGNFRASEMNFTHNFGTYMTCLFGTLDVVIQSKIAYDNKRANVSLSRVLVVCIILPSFLGYVFIRNYFVHMVLANTKLSDKFIHNTSAICEWIGFCMFGPFYATFVPEFMDVKIAKFVIILDDHNQNKSIGKNQ